MNNYVKYMLGVREPQVKKGSSGLGFGEGAEHSLQGRGPERWEGDICNLKLFSLFRQEI